MWLGWTHQKWLPWLVQRRPCDSGRSILRGGLGTAWNYWKEASLLMKRTGYKPLPAGCHRVEMSTHRKPPYRNRAQRQRGNRAWRNTQASSSRWAKYVFYLLSDRFSKALGDDAHSFPGYHKNCINSCIYDQQDRTSTNSFSPSLSSPHSPDWPVIEGTRLRSPRPY